MISKMLEHQLLALRSSIDSTSNYLILFLVNPVVKASESKTLPPRVGQGMPRVKTTLTTPPKIDKCRVLHTSVPKPCDGRVSTPSVDHFAKFSSQKARVAFGSSWAPETADKNKMPK